MNILEAKKRVSFVFEMLEENFGEKKDVRFKVYLMNTLKQEFKVASDLETYNMLEAVFTAVIKDRVYKKFPTISEFIEAGNKILKRTTDDITTEAELEFEKAINAVSTVGVYRIPIFDNLLTQHIIKITFLGWMTFCNELSDDNMVFKRRQFIEAYTRLYDRKDSIEYKPLSAITSQTKMVGDETKCKAIAKKHKEEMENYRKAISKARNGKTINIKAIGD